MAPRISDVTYYCGCHTTFTLVALLFSQAGLGTPVSTTESDCGRVVEHGNQRQTFPIRSPIRFRRTTIAHISRRVIFRNNPGQQKAVVPLDTGKASSYTLMQDNTEVLTDQRQPINPNQAQP
jgi:hypothetical protein